MSFFKKILGGGEPAKDSSPETQTPASGPTGQSAASSSGDLHIVGFTSPEYHEALRQHKEYSRNVPALDLDETGISWNGGGQKKLVTEVLPKWRPEVSELLESEHLTEIEGDPVVLDHAILYSLICELEPSRLIEIGCGRTTHTIRAAFKKHTMPCELIAIDPKPRIEIDEVVDAHMDQCVQEIPLEDYRMLQSGEMLILDLSHIYLPGSDVGFVYDRILPILHDGVIVCVMGVSMNVLKHINIQNAEFILLRQFLAGNQNIEVMYSGDWAPVNCAQELAQYWEVDEESIESKATWFRIKK